MTRTSGWGRVWPLALAVMLMAGAADAKPRRRDARIAFERGVTAYQKGNFEAASEALGKSFTLERDVETLFAWAQSERQLEHCDKAIELYEKLLTFNLSQANKSAVEMNLEECRAAVAQQKAPVEPKPVEPKPVEPKPTEPIAPDARAPVPEPRVAESAALTPVAPLPPVGDTPAPGRPWYKDPVAIGLGGGGLVAIGVGAGLLVSAKSLDSDAKNEKDDHDRAKELGEQARMRGNIGGVTAAVGVAALVGAAVWVVTHRSSGESRTVTGWLAPDSGGIGVAGAF